MYVWCGAVWCGVVRCGVMCCDFVVALGSVHYDRSNALPFNQEEDDGITRFNSWEECYEKHHQASDELERLIHTLKTEPYNVSKEEALLLCNRVPY